MPKPRLVIKGATADEIRQMLRKDEKYKIGVRLYAIYQIANGAASRDLEQIYNVSFKSVCNWVHQFNEKGIEGLKDKPRFGRTPRLNAEQLSQLKETILNEDPQNYNYNTSTWTGPLIIDLVKNKFGVEYKKAQIYNILKSIGLTYQKSKGIYPEADENKRQEFNEALKKTAKSNQQSGDII